MVLFSKSPKPALPYATRRAFRLYLHGRFPERNGFQSPATDRRCAQRQPGTMITLCRFLFLFTAIASTAFSLAVPPTSDLSLIHQPVNLTSTPAANLSSSNSAAHCFTNTSPFTRRRPRFTDCGAAIRELPSNHIIGYFHTDGDDDQFRLPVERTSGSCTVEVRMQTGFRDDTSTWLEVGSAATQLNMACVNTFTFPVKIGGWTTAGRLERITVMLHFSGTRNRLESL